MYTPDLENKDLAGIGMTCDQTKCSTREETQTLPRSTVKKKKKKKKKEALKPRYMDTWIRGLTMFS